MKTVSSIPLLSTKLRIPFATSHMVARPRLTEQLGREVAGKLTLVSAAAGFGKTTLLSHWARQSDQPVAWLSLDEGDNVVKLFWAYAIAALQTIRPAVGEQALIMLQAAQPIPLESILSLLMSEIDTDAEAFTFVLEDYHLITSDAIHKGITYLLTHMPPQMHIIISSRTEPPLPLARLRVSRQLNELRVADLRFNDQEVVQFLEQVAGVRLAKEDVTAVANRTEGWVAGLQLAGLSLQRRQGNDYAIKDDFIKAFTGSQRYVLDYLAEEVFANQPLHIQTFLLQTSILQSLNASLCHAVTGHDDSQMMLEQLEQANLFIVALDEERGWYRYHHLFAEFLQNRLQQTAGIDLSQLHHRASVWYEERSLVDEAMRHALSGENYVQAARIEEKFQWSMQLQGRHGTVMRWLNTIPEAIFDVRPQLCVNHSVMLWLMERLHKAERRLDQAEANLPVEGLDMFAPMSATPGFVNGMRGMIAYKAGDLDRAISLSRQSLAALHEADHYARASVLVNLADAYLKQGNLTLAREAYEESLNRGERSGHIFVVLRAVLALGELHQLQGHLHQAYDFHQQALQISEEHVQHGSFRGGAYAWMGELQYQWNDLKTAVTYLKQSIEQSQELWTRFALETAHYQLIALLSMARVRWAMGYLPDALAYMQEAELLVQNNETAAAGIDHLVRLEVQLALAQGDVDRAVIWANKPESSGFSPNDFGYAIRPLSRARVLVAQGDADGALQTLAPLQREAEETGLADLLIETLMLKSLALQVQGEGETAVTALNEALTLAQPEGYVRLFVDEGEPMYKLLNQVQVGGRHSKYIACLLAAFAPPSPTKSSPLTGREFEIVQLISQNLSNPKIALTLLISVNTVKTHVKRIYHKLDVNSRVALLERVRQLGLLP